MPKSDVDLSTTPEKMSTTLDIPTSTRGYILPPAWISDLLQFRGLPTICAAPRQLSLRAEEWFSHSPVDPTFTPAMLGQIALPPLEIIDKLDMALQESQLTALKSVTPLHLPTDYSGPRHLPLWTVSYWRSAL